MDDLLRRLGSRRFPGVSAYAGNIASAAYMQPSYAVEVRVGGEDVDIADAIAEITRLRKALGAIIAHEESTDLIINIAGDALNPLLSKDSK